MNGTFAHNPIVDLLKGVDRRISAIAQRELNAIDSSNTQEWPEAPYHHGMGRILEYEAWRNSLPLSEREAEIAAARIRYQDYNAQRAIALYQRMKTLGINLPWSAIPGFNPDNPPTGGKLPARNFTEQNRISGQGPVA